MGNHFFSFLRLYVASTIFIVPKCQYEAISFVCQWKYYPALWYWIWCTYSRFIVKKGAPGLKATKIENNIGLRMVQNGDIVLNEVFVPEEDRLPGINSFKDINKVLDTSFTTSSAPFFVGWRFLFSWTLTSDEAGVCHISCYRDMAANRHINGSFWHVP